MPKLAAPMTDFRLRGSFDFHYAVDEWQEWKGSNHRPTALKTVTSHINAC